MLLARPHITLGNRLALFDLGRFIAKDRLGLKKFIKLDNLTRKTIQQ